MFSAFSATGSPIRPPAAVPYSSPAASGTSPSAPRQVSANLLAGAFPRPPSTDVTLFLAGRTATEIWIQRVGARSGITIVETTDDGTRGATTVASPTPFFPAVCLRSARSKGSPAGPTPMLKALKALAVAHDFPCHLRRRRTQIGMRLRCSANARVVEDAAQPGNADRDVPRRSAFSDAR
jgi:hypothetical protein